jgi:O-antigen ligase
MARRDLRLLLGLTALTLALVAIQALTGAEVLLASPALVLALPLLAGRWGVDCSKGCRVWFEVDRRSRGPGRFGREE